MTSSTNPILRRRLLAAGAAASLVGCAQRGELADEEEPLPARLGDWQEVRLPGKRSTQYRWARKDGRDAIEAYAERSASMMRRKLDPAASLPATLSFSWWAPEVVADGHVTAAHTEDAVARVLLSFGGDHSRLSTKNRMLFDMAEALSGERPPYATLMYVWCARAPVESVVVNPRIDRVRKIVADSGRHHLGRWREHRRDIVADFERAFGEAPGPLLSVAVMTDADNTASMARAWYGPVRLA